MINKTEKNGYIIITLINIAFIWCSMIYNHRYAKFETSMYAVNAVGLALDLLFIIIVSCSESDDVNFGSNVGYYMLSSGICTICLPLIEHFKFKKYLSKPIYLLVFLLSLVGVNLLLRLIYFIFNFDPKNVHIGKKNSVYRLDNERNY